MDLLIDLNYLNHVAFHFFLATLFIIIAEELGVATLRTVVWFLRRLVNRCRSNRIRGMKLNEIVFVNLCLKSNEIIRKIGFMSMPTNLFEIFESLQGVKNSIILILDKVG